MGLFDKLKNKENKEIMLEENILEITEKSAVYNPIEGEVISLADIGDGVFSEGIVGMGYGVRPTEGIVVAPFAGTVLQVAGTKHAIGLESNDGIELLIHVGIDTVTMNGKGFEPKVKVGDKVKCGQVLMKFSIADIEAAGFPTTAAVIVTNSDDVEAVEVQQLGHIKKSEKILQVK